MSNLTIKQMQKILNDNLLNYSNFELYDKKRMVKFNINLVVLDTIFTVPLPVSETEFKEQLINNILVLDLNNLLNDDVVTDYLDSRPKVTLDKDYAVHFMQDMEMDYDYLQNISYRLAGQVARDKYPLKLSKPSKNPLAILMAQDFSKWSKESWLHSPRHKVLEFPEWACLSLNTVQDFLSSNNLAFDAIKAQTKIMQGFGVDLMKIARKSPDFSPG